MSQPGASNRPAAPRLSHRLSIRSRLGCLTCKRRKVKCDEQRPRCNHCERLALECKWHAGAPFQRARGGSDRSQDSDSNRVLRTPVPESEPPPNGPLFQTPPLHAVNELFDYASFMWDMGGDTVWHQLSPDAASQTASLTGPSPTAAAAAAAAAVAVSVSAAAAAAAAVDDTDPTLVHTGSAASIDSYVDVATGPAQQQQQQQQQGYMAMAAATASDPTTSMPPDLNSQIHNHSNHDASNSRNNSSINNNNNNNTDNTNAFSADSPMAENHRLMDYFTHAVTPPILAEVETQKNWLSMRQILVGMASSSRMVRWAVLAFSNLMLARGDAAWMASAQDHYKNATAEVTACEEHESQALAKPGALRTNLLATFFFLSYIDILEARIEAAHSNLKRAHTLFEYAAKDSLHTTEKQLLLWIRLLDARAVSAGGEGLFLSKDEEGLLVDQGSPDLRKDALVDVTHTADDHTPGADMEDVLFQVLYQPGIVFFQRVQSFMGRISKIDPWHRSRGTVEDETEVMALGAAIAADLRSLFDQRPPLMDFAVAGKLTPPHVSAHLAFVITRAFRTYLSNYYASKVHLHRVVYKTFPLTTEAADALEQIKILTRLIVEGLDHGDPLPVNMLWPLLMLGSEEQDLDERAWVKSQILRMEKVAGNAKITAQVLEEVQTRQDTLGARVDIRSVMHAIFNRCFAIV